MSYERRFAEGWKLPAWLKRGKAAPCKGCDNLTNFHHRQLDEPCCSGRCYLKVAKVLGLGTIAH